jgi:hypothetical protein
MWLQLSPLVDRGMRDDAQDRRLVRRETRGPNCLAQRLAGGAVRLDEDEPIGMSLAELDGSGRKPLVERRVVDQPGGAAYCGIPEMDVTVHETMHDAPCRSPTARNLTRHVII